MFHGFQFYINKMMGYELFCILLHWLTVTLARSILIVVTVVPSWSYLFPDGEHMSLFPFDCQKQTMLLVVYGFHCCVQESLKHTCLDADLLGTKINASLI